jgi:hypothetical protein
LRMWSTWGSTNAFMLSICEADILALSRRLLLKIKRAEQRSKAKKIFQIYLPLTSQTSRSYGISEELIPRVIWPMEEMMVTPHRSKCRLRSIVRKEGTIRSKGRLQPVSFDFWKASRSQCMLNFSVIVYHDFITLSAWRLRASYTGYFWSVSGDQVRHFAQPNNCLRDPL